MQACVTWSQSIEAASSRQGDCLALNICDGLLLSICFSGERVGRAAARACWGGGGGALFGAGTWKHECVQNPAPRLKVEGCQSPFQFAWTPLPFSLDVPAKDTLAWIDPQIDSSLSEFSTGCNTLHPMLKATTVCRTIQAVNGSQNWSRHLIRMESVS